MRVLSRLPYLLLFFCMSGPLINEGRAQQALLTVPDGPSDFDAAIQQSRMHLRMFMEEGHIPGISVAVLIDGEIVWSEGFGFADLEQGVPVTSLTKMRIGSVAKPITAAGMAILVEEGKLDLDAPVQTYVPSFPEKQYDITTRQLAGHIAGIRHYRGQEFMSSAYFPTVAEGLAIFEEDPLLFEPGERYSYSSYGWNLISAVMEGASSEPFLDFMQDRVFDPMGMRYTRAEHMDSLIYRRSRYYVKNPAGNVLNAPFVDNSYKWAGGGFVSTAEDVVTFGHGMLSHKILQPETVNMLFTSLKTNAGEETGYGLGWRSGETDEGRSWVGHSGGSMGGTTHFFTYPEEGVIICLISNLSGTRNQSQITQDIAKIFIEAKQLATVEE